MGPLLRQTAVMFGMVGSILISMFWWIPLVLAGFQLISKARAIAEVENAKILSKELPNYMVQFNRMVAAISVIFRPLTMLWNKLAEGLSWIFRLDGALAILGWGLSKVANFMTALAKEAAIFQALVEGVLVAVTYAMQRVFSGSFKNLGSDMYSVFSMTAQESFDKNMKMLKDSENNMISSQITNIGSVNIQNSFKEQLEPDRIAFTIRDQLLSAARNPVSGRNQVTRNTGSKQ